jgi:hypothetical protein
LEVGPGNSLGSLSNQFHIAIQLSVILVKQQKAISWCLLSRFEHGSFTTRKNDTVLCIPPPTVSTLLVAWSKIACNVELAKHVLSSASMVTKILYPFSNLKNPDLVSAFATVFILLGIRN